MLKILALSIGLVSISAFADPISKSVILNKVMDGSARFESKLIHFVLESADKSTLDTWSSKQKLVYPKFESDLLYYRYTYDDSYEYQFYFNYVQNECRYQAVERDSVKIARLCKNDIDNCLQKQGGAKEENDIVSCHKRSTNCSRLKTQGESDIIEKKYCEKIYGRSL